jgi:hypothetical protein
VAVVTQVRILVTADEILFLHKIKIIMYFEIS